VRIWKPTFPGIARGCVPDMTAGSRRILLTGASGFVGRHLMNALSLAYPDATLLAPSFDVSDAAAVSEIVATAQAECCIHLAAISTIAAAQANPDHAWRVNLLGTLHVARAILSHVPKCQMIFASTAEAYGAAFRHTATLDEAAVLAPLNVYAATKAAADLALGSMVEQGLRVVRLRAFNHTGPGQSPNFVVAAFARQAARIAAGLQAPVVEVGNLEPRRDFLDVRDVCAAYVACIERRDSLAPDAILNIASGEAQRIGDVLRDMLALAGVTASVRVDRSRLRSTDILLVCGNATRARELLGWTPGTPWRQTLQDVLDDWRGRVATETAER
jgi:GDP-4-dehydro-6-deoxy-D-mannose reductase